MATTIEHVSSPLLTSDEAGQYLRRDGRTLANWRVRGYGPDYVRIGRTAFYRVEALDRWLHDQTFAHGAAERQERHSAIAEHTAR